MPRIALLLFVALLLGLAQAPLAAQPDTTYEAGRSTVEIEGLQVELNVPKDLTKEDPASLVIILHGAGGTALGMAGLFSDWDQRGYVVCAPKSKGQVWTQSDVGAVLKIAEHLKAKLPIDGDKVHVVGYSNGGWNLQPLAFDDTLKPRSATWVASGCDAAKLPKWAKERLAVLAMAGSQDANAKAARGTVKAIGDQVRSVGVKLQPGLGHQWPTKLMPYFRWWVDTVDGRFTPGVDMNFAWGERLDRALSSVSGKKKGGVFVYVWDPSDADNEVAQSVSRDMFMDLHARHYGKQLTPVKLELGKHKELLEGYGITTSPALLLLKTDGKKKKVLLEKDLKTRKVVTALKSLAPNKKKPGGR